MAKWQFDPAHTNLDFVARHMMVTTVRGTFRIFDGAIDFDPDNLAAGGKVRVNIDVNSIDTGVEQRDGHLRSGDFFDVDNYPAITFQSTHVELTDDQQGRVTGDLTIRGVTRPVTLDVEFFGVHKSPFGDKRAGFEAQTTINREDWGLTWNQTLESGGVLVSKEIKLNLSVQAVLQTETETQTQAV